jgi:hypothetical protein
MRLQDQFPSGHKDSGNALTSTAMVQRILVLQEVKAAKHSYILYGNEKMDFFHFYLLFYMHNIERDDPLEQIPYSVSSYDRLGKRGGKCSAKTSWLGLLCATRHFGAKDARDKFSL